jgi:hypothetical protein
MIMDTSDFANIQAEGDALQSQLSNVEPCIKKNTPSVLTLSGIFSAKQFDGLKLDDALYVEVDQSDFYSDYMNFLSFLQDGEYYSAGNVFAKIFTLDGEDSVSSIPFDEWRAFLTGKFAALNLTEPSDIFECFDSQEAVESIAFFKSWASSVSESSSHSNITASTWTYLQNKRATWYQGQNSSVGSCVNGTSSAVKFNHALGFPLGTSHQDTIQSFFSNGNNEEIYYSSFSKMNEDFQQQEFYQAGKTFGELLYQVSEAGY